MNGVDADGQCFLQVLEDVQAGTGAGGRALCRGLVQQLLEALQFNQQYHVLQEIALDKGRKLAGTQELKYTNTMIKYATLNKFKYGYGQNAFVGVY